MLFDHGISGSIMSSSSSSRHLETAQLTPSPVLEFSIWAAEVTLRQCFILT